MTESLKLSNGFIDCFIDAEFGGRIAHLSFHREPNLLYYPTPHSNGDWTNYGGDFFWLAPQQLWGWPPPAQWDREPWTCVTDDEVVLISPIWKGYELSREISFSSTHEIQVINRIRNIKGTPMPLGAWTITQVAAKSHSVRIPDLSHLRVFDYPPNVDLAVLSESGAVKLEKGQVVAAADRAEAYKIGGLSKSGYKVLSSEKGSILKRMSMSGLPLNKKAYPHQGNVEVYHNDEYFEAEFVWPLQVLKRGQEWQGRQWFELVDGGRHP